MYIYTFSLKTPSVASCIWIFGYARIFSSLSYAKMSKLSFHLVHHPYPEFIQ